MMVNWIMLGFTGLYLLGTFLYYKYTVRKGIVFRYKPIALLIVGVLFLLALYGLIVGKPYSEILPFIG
ncbi:hypothetical protein F0L74_15255 [Chitinophaga agrisoli]|uniref:Uncharacterized protein n=1 Tax=Chitinophaga agrisoli TaxID=2607653 RepID=A0A5B2VZ92_9BACT|nr:hypothetical protein [Chitinophaga agrisoli]KAA2243830.1 hypothetical protein F0L74_15255 [Chitinophaga agrisoli]